MLNVSAMLTNGGYAARNQFVISDTDNQKVTFKSYNSNIVEVDDKNHTITLFPDWDYSQTTGKYRNKFLRDCGFDSLDSKKGLEKAMKQGVVSLGIYDYKIQTA